MSSFICGAKHFNSIEKALHRVAVNNEIYLSSDMKEICPAWYTGDSKAEIEKEISQLVDTLRNINVLCVSLQYKHHYEGKLDQEITDQLNLVKEKTKVKELSLHGLYNALRCLNYQIEIEHLMGLRELTPEEKNALLFLDTIMNLIAHKLVSDLPEDKTNRWEVN